MSLQKSVPIHLHQKFPQLHRALLMAHYTYTYGNFGGLREIRREHHAIENTLYNLTKHIFPVLKNTKFPFIMAYLVLQVHLRLELSHLVFQQVFLLQSVKSGKI